MTKTLTMPVPTSKNVWQRQHWSKRSRTKRHWHDLVWAQVNSVPRWKRPAATVTADLDVFWDKPGVLPDHHNLDMAHECVADGLVKSGILADDAGGVYQRGTFSITRVPKGQGKAILTLHIEYAG